VLIWGESGTGKSSSPNDPSAQPARGPAVRAINCAAIPETLLESEIFGHREGRIHRRARSPPGMLRAGGPRDAFPGRNRRNDPATQVKLLRVLQERTFRRLGGRGEMSVDVRVIAATNVNPAEAVKNGKLREDLYYRLNVFAIQIRAPRPQGRPAAADPVVSQRVQRTQQQEGGCCRSRRDTHARAVQLAGQRP